MRSSEAIAKITVEKVLQGTKLLYRTDQSHGQYDFDIQFENGNIAPLEVTESTESVMRQLQSTLNKRGALYPLPKCRNGWLINLSVGVQLQLLAEKIDDYLAEIEAQGLDEFSIYSDSYENWAVKRIVQDLKVESGKTTIWKKPTNRVGLLGPGMSNIVVPSNGTLAIEIEANKSDNRRKLTTDSVAGSHLFVLVDILNFAAWTAITESEAPNEVPDLPTEISHVWAAAMKGECCYVWRATRTESWRAEEPILIAGESIAQVIVGHG